MTILVFTGVVAIVSFAAGFLGSLTGLGGGVVIVPLLTIFFHVDIRYAIGASLVSVIATSSGAAAAYVKEGFSNIRIGMFLEIATTAGSAVGRFSRHPHSDQRAGRHLRLGAALLGISFAQAAAARPSVTSRPIRWPRVCR